MGRAIDARWWGLAAVVLACAVGCGRQPQMGGDEGVFRAVDALFTAVSLRETKLVDQCAADLDGLRGAGKLPEGASEALERVIAEARRGEWVPSQERLRRFMLGQRRS